MFPCWILAQTQLLPIVCRGRKGKFSIRFNREKGFLAESQAFDTAEQPGGEPPAGRSQKKPSQTPAALKVCLHKVFALVRKKRPAEAPIVRSFRGK